MLAQSSQRLCLLGDVLLDGRILGYAVGNVDQAVGRGRHHEPALFIESESQVPQGPAITTGLNYDGACIVAVRDDDWPAQSSMTVTTYNGVYVGNLFRHHTLQLDAA